MRYKVNIGDRVYERLADSLSYIPNDLGSPLAAQSLLDAFEDAVVGLETFPENHPISHDASRMLDFIVRRAPVKSYELFYYVDKPSALVQAFSLLHSRQDIKAHIGTDCQPMN